MGAKSAQRRLERNQPGALLLGGGARDAACAVDFARSRMAQRRANGDVPGSLEDSEGERFTPDHGLLVEIGILMDRLEQEHPQLARVVDLHYFAGFTLEEIAKLTGLTLRQVRRRWAKGRDRIKDRLDGGQWKVRD